jgi:hypothetical protein
MRIGSLAQQNFLFWASQFPGAAVAVAVPNGGSRSGLRLQSVTGHDREPPPGGGYGQAAEFPVFAGYLAAPAR